MVRVQLIDGNSNFSCGSCTACCDQPWRTLIEIEKAAALDRHDFSRYPQLAQRSYYRKPPDGDGRFYELNKGEGTRCIFLDTDGLCIIHKELGAEAKPRMCRQFPYLPSRAWRDDRVSVNFGCPSVQADKGVPLPAQKDEIAAIVPLTDPSVKADARVPFDAASLVSQPVHDAIIDRAMNLFDERVGGDIFVRFARLLNLLAEIKSAMAESEGDSALMAALESRRTVVDDSPSIALETVERPATLPMPARFLLAATLQPDTLPADAAAGLGLFRRLTLVPKLMSLATLHGAYASRLLGRNVSLTNVFAHPLSAVIDASSTALLLRYFRSRFWQRLIVGTRLPIVGGVHQHILDLSAIMFFARAEAQQAGSSQLEVSHVRHALTRVEFHLANQRRLYDCTLRKWIRRQLCDLDVARQSLRLAALPTPGGAASNQAGALQAPATVVEGAESPVPRPARGHELTSARHGG